MSAKKELLERELDIERRELERHPEAETKELAATFARRGLDDADAYRLAGALMGDPENAPGVQARAELGFHPGQTGTAWQAAISSFVSFGVGAIIPLVPWFFTSGAAAVIASIILGAVSALAIGWGGPFFTARWRISPAVRQLLIGGVAAAVTFGVGTLVGVGLHTGA